MYGLVTAFIALPPAPPTAIWRHIAVPKGSFAAISLHIALRRRERPGGQGAGEHGFSARWTMTGSRCGTSDTVNAALAVAVRQVRLAAFDVRRFESTDDDIATARAHRSDVR